MARTEFDEDMFLFIDSLLKLGCTPTTVYDGVSTIVYQSIPKGESITSTTHGIDLVVIQYVSPISNGADNGTGGNP
jgi:hypothetical protein